MKTKIHAIKTKPIAQIDLEYISRTVKMGENLVEEIQKQIYNLRKSPDPYIKVQAHDALHGLMRSAKFMDEERCYMRGTNSICMDPTLSSSVDAKSYREAMKENTHERHAIFISHKNHRPVLNNDEMKTFLQKLLSLIGIKR